MSSGGGIQVVLMMGTLSSGRGEGVLELKV